MKIARIFAHRVELPLVEGSYKWSGGKSVSVFDSTIVGVETDCGLVGYGEVCPLGPFYLPAYAEGVRAGLRELGPHLLGFDPRELAKLNHRMDAALKGHPYVKIGNRHRLLGHSRQGHATAGLHVAGRPVWRERAAVSRDLAAGSRRDGEECAGLSRAGLHAVSAQSGRRSRYRHRTDSRRASDAAADRPACRRRQHRLDAARSDARCASRAATSTFTSNSPA